MKTFRVLATLGVAVAFGLAMLGSWTRINQAGMTCPDWPLCRGAIVPALHGGVVYEWTHRLIALIETFVVASVIAAGLQVRSQIPALRGLLVALGAVFVLQVLIGGVTIAFANSPLSVMIHWGCAMLLLATLTSIAVLAFARNERGEPPSLGWRGTGPLLVATAWLFITMCAGAFVSSSGFGLACPSVPGCGPGFLGQNVPQDLQMMHRILAFSFVVVAVAALMLAPRVSRRPRRALHVGLTLMVLQIALGGLNVVLLMPTPLRLAHAANAVLTFLTFVIATVFASLDSERVPESRLRSGLPVPS
jgi:heme A synthase